MGRAQTEAMATLAEASAPRKSMQIATILVKSIGGQPLLE